MKKNLLALLFLLIISAFGATQSTSLVLTEFPAAIVHPDSSVAIKWTGQNLETATIYYGSKPGGSKISNYSKKISLTNVEYTDKGLPERGITFTPSQIATMGTGIFYLMVASSETNYSNEIKFIVKNASSVQMISPVGAKITNVTPSFRWTPLSDVPYYHVIVTDEKISIGSDNKVSGLSIIWQAITSSDQIVYGAPDPSGTITATPPPLSPGVNYSWFVLNNYGNNAALSAFDMKIPSAFALMVDTMKSPKPVWPLDSSDHDYTQYSSTKPFKLKWTNLDPNANTYKVYLYAKSEDTAFSAKIAVWDGEVTAGSFAGNDTGSIEINATNILTTNDYVWKVIAVNSSGKGQASTRSSFHFDGLSGGILAKTYEKITTPSGVVEQKVGLAEIKVEVLDGSLEKPLLFFTDQNGFLYRSRPVGTYRLTAVKDGYKTATKTVTITKGDTSKVTFYLERPDASVFGSVLDADKTQLNLAKVVGVSTFGDSIKTETDPSGNFVLNCGKGDWDISATKSGYVSPLPVRVSVDYGQSKSLSAPITLTKNSYSLSGTVVNSQGAPLTAAKVVLQDKFGTIISEVPSTSSSGAYSFSLNAGTYTLVVSKTGFTSFSETFQFASSTVKTVKLSEGAAQIKGSIYGRNWSKDSVTVQTIAAIRDLTIKAYDINNVEVASSVTDVWGNFTLGVSGGNKPYTLKYGASGFISDSTTTSPVLGGSTVLFNDTINGLANLYSSVKYSVDGKLAEGVAISLSDSAKDITIATGTSDNLGTVELYKIPDGIYQLKAAGNNLFADSIQLVSFDGSTIETDVIHIANGRIMSGSSIIKNIKVSVVEGKGAISWIVNKPLTAKGSVAINVISPLITKVNEGDTLSSIGLGSYRIEVNSEDPFVLDCSRHLTSVLDADSAKLDTVYLPFSHVAPENSTYSTNGISLTVQTGEAHLKSTIQSAVAYYRTFGATDYTQATGTVATDNSCTFALSNVAAGTYTEYYFVITLNNGDVFGYSKELYRTFVQPNAKVLSRIEVIPVADSSGYTLPLGGTMNLEVRGYYGDKFTPVGVLKAGDIIWENPGVALSASSASASAALTATASGSLIMKFTGAESGYTLEPGMESSDTITVNVTTAPLASLKIERISLHEKDIVLNRVGAQFSTQGFDQGGTRVQVSPKWSITPETAGTISESGILTLTPGFIGRVQILASINDSIRDLFTLSSEDEQQAQPGMLVAHSIRTDDKLLSLHDGLDLSIAVPESSVVSGTAIMSVDNPSYDNKVYKTIPEAGISLISKIYQIQLRDAKFESDTVSNVTRASKVTASIRIPKQYKEFVDATGSRFTLGVWNPDSLKWQSSWQKSNKSRASDSTADTLPAILGSVTWTGDTVNAYTVSIGDALNTSSSVQLAVLFNETDNVVGDFEVSPNPFSPYVAPENDYVGLAGMNSSIKGTCLKIIPMNSTSSNNPDITVNIYTANRTLVWETQLNSVIPGKEYFIFWDGKTRIGRSQSKDQIKTAENKVIYPQGDEMCRNGRYFAIVTIDDGNEKKRFTKEIILFK